MTKINWSILDTVLARYGGLKDILRSLIKHRATPYLVGGCVRDIVLGLEIKDVDIEVHNLTLETLEKILAEFGHVRLAGKQFGVLRIDGLNIDWSIPRRDSKGRKPAVEFDSTMTIEQAARRRDITMNAMAINLHEALEGKHAIIDPFNGLDALSKKELRAIDNQLFLEDPLRFYRVMHFIGRFEMSPDKNLNELCTSIDLSNVSRERIFEELCKLLLKSGQPSRGIRWLKTLGRLKEIMPELHACIGVVQPAQHHPEGDVFEHSMQALDAAARYEDLEHNEKLLIMFATLCHDLGKPSTTDAQGHAYGHDLAGVELTKTFLKRFTDNVNLIHASTKLVRHHLAPGQLIAQNSGLKAYKRLALKLSPQATMLELALVACADAQGRNSQSKQPLSFEPDFFKPFLKKAHEAGVTYKPEEPVLKGRDLEGLVEKGPAMGKLLERAYDIQIEEGVSDKEELKRRILRSGRS
jgi:tRNA nucleotidyltransferase (CCA-adding enzyme)